MKKLKQFKPKRHTTRKKFSGTKRETRQSVGYGKNWLKYRYRFLHHNPYCCACNERATVVDHAVPWKVDKEKWFWNIENYLPFCHSCHSTVTAKFDRQQNPDLEGKDKWIAQRRKELNITRPVKRVPFKGENL